jgi:hypothetical protein
MSGHGTWSVQEFDAANRVIMFSAPTPPALFSYRKSYRTQSRSPVAAASWIMLWIVSCLYPFPFVRPHGHVNVGRGSHTKVPSDRRRGHMS